MIARKYTHADYEKLAGWWQAWGWPAFPQNLLAPTGIIVSNEGKDICAAWLYKTDSPICWVENIVSDKAASKEDRAPALDLLLLSLADEAKAAGFSIIMTSVKHPGLARRLLKDGYLKSDDNMIHFVRQV